MKRPSNFVYGLGIGSAVGCLHYFALKGDRSPYLERFRYFSRFYPFTAVPSASSLWEDSLRYGALFDIDSMLIRKVWKYGRPNLIIRPNIVQLVEENDNKFQWFFTSRQPRRVVESVRDSIDPKKKIIILDHPRRIVDFRGRFRPKGIAEALGVKSIPDRLVLVSGNRNQYRRLPVIVIPRPLHGYDSTLLQLSALLGLMERSGEIAKEFLEFFREPNKKSILENFGISRNLELLKKCPPDSPEDSLSWLSRLDSLTQNDLISCMMRL